MHIEIAEDGKIIIKVKSEAIFAYWSIPYIIKAPWERQLSKEAELK